MEISSASLIYFLFLLVHCSLPSLAEARRTNIDTDRSALLALKAHITDDPHNILTTNWSAGAPVCNWIGITCEAKHHRVTTLNLSDMGLTGTLPPHLGNLSFLSSVSFRNNKFHGSLPNKLASLRRLKLLDFAKNNFDGQLPTWFGFLPGLQELYLTCNLFTGTIPASLCNISSLRTIFLDENMLSGEVPPNIGNLPNLLHFDIGSNNITGLIPHEIFNHSRIKWIALSRNHLLGQLPGSLGCWVPNLEVLYLWQNNLEGIIPSSIANASKLSVLDLADNLFSGSIPRAISNLRHLRLLHLGRNLFTREPTTLELGFLSSLTNCRNLTDLSLSYNPLNGTLPIDIGNFSTSLTYFGASRCNIKGNIPRQIGNLSNLIALNLSYNELVGHIPSAIGGIQGLQVLHLQQNRLRGPIPNHICHLSKLSELSLSGNDLYGSIPTCWGSLTSLRKLSVATNHLTSTIPSSFWSLKDLLEVDFSWNYLNGHLPLDIGNLKVMTKMDFSWNQFSGKIPTTIGGLQNLVNLSLAHNKFQVPILEQFSKLVSMEVLDLSHNNLSGGIPKSLEELKYLKYLNVSFNRLRGQIPLGGAFANISAQSFMGNEELCGPARQQVPPCEVVRQSKRPIKVTLIYVLPVLMVTIPISILLIKCQKRNTTLPSQGVSTLVAWRRISYLELERATNGFSNSNFVGKGSFGSVYKGMLSDGMSIAVKVLNQDVEGSFKSFDIECDILYRARHRNLIKIISCCSSIDFKALVLEYMPNGSLSRWLYSSYYSLGILQRLNLMLDVALSLEYLHHDHLPPIIHGDLKPSNILLNQDMVAHVSDFGHSKLLGDGDYVAQTQSLATIGYMAPEYGLQGILSPSSDVYSYGILLMETFTGKKPTNELFAGQISLKHWVKMSQPHAVEEIIDANLIEEGEKHFAAKKDCVLSIMQLAFDCTMDVPEERINMRLIVTTLKKIKMNFLMLVQGA